ncbi:MaoC family dehydratase [Pseudonocardia ailaonensis]|uniref:MaoC family dehydratase n=1 Tax=Pseudonocardia ailaonensis TaxID=367279 RepID=A0ABN2NGK4_9PSEU
MSAGVGNGLSTGAGTVRVGDERTTVVVEDLKRAQIVQYAGASGDFNPVHTDEPFATGPAASPSVFAHGMLTMGMAGRALTDWFGPEAPLTYKVRFLTPVFPGSTLSVRAEVRAVEGDTATVGLTVTDQNGVTVMTGDATVRTSEGARP